jgi:hypothetical protein
MEMIGKFTMQIGNVSLCVNDIPLLRHSIFRFVDRDMVMRYHWGLGIGHFYSYGHQPGSGVHTTKLVLNTVTGNLDEDALGMEEHTDGQDTTVSGTLGGAHLLHLDHDKDSENLNLQELAKAHSENASDSDDDPDDLEFGSDSEFVESDLGEHLEDDMELFDMFGDTQEMQFTSYD